MKKIFSSLFVVFLYLGTLHAQEHVVHGIINTLDSIPLIGVQVKVKSSKQIVETDSLGKFTALCNKKDKLGITANGFYPENVKITDKIKFVALNMRLKPGEKQRQYAIGYGHISEEDLTSSVLNMEKGDTRFSRFSNMYDLLRSTGVEIRGNQVIIRGSKTFQGNDAALIVVDDVVSDYGILGTLRPIEIKSVNIIKDGTSAIYGSRGANGVVLIETLKGR